MWALVSQASNMQAHLLDSVNDDGVVDAVFWPYIKPLSRWMDAIYSAYTSRM